MASNTRTSNGYERQDTQAAPSQTATNQGAWYPRRHHWDPRRHHWNLWSATANCGGWCGSQPESKADGVARNLGIPRTFVPQAPPKPDDTNAVLWFHKDLPEHMFRIVRPDFGCLTFQYHPIHTLRMHTTFFKVQVFDAGAACRGPEKRSPFIHVYDNLKSAQRELKCARNSGLKE